MGSTWDLCISENISPTELNGSHNYDVVGTIGAKAHL